MCGLTFGEMMRVRAVYRRMKSSAWWRGYVCSMLTVVALSDWRNSDETPPSKYEMFAATRWGFVVRTSAPNFPPDTRQIEGACRGLLGRAIDAWKRATTYQDGTVRAIERWPTPGSARSTWCGRSSCVF